MRATDALLSASTIGIGAGAGLADAVRIAAEYSASLWPLLAANFAGAVARDVRCGAFIGCAETG